jgi:hypothetical protein
MKQKVSNESALYFLGWILIALFIIVYLVLINPPLFIKTYLLPCVFQLITGYYCPGCGGTRAVSALLHGNVIKSMLYHPLVTYGAIVGGWFMITQTVERISQHQIKIGMKYRHIYIWLAVAILILNFIIKNAALYSGMDLLN